MTLAFASLAEQIAYVGQRMFERKLHDMAGGNISARDGDLIYCTPRYAGSKYHWQLDPDQVLCGTPEELMANPLFSREGKAHLAIYREFPDANAVVHCHAFHILAFCAAERAIEPILEATEKFGVVDVVQGAPAHSAELADYVVAGLRGKDARIRTQAAAVLMPKHGIIAAGKDLFATVDAVERIDWNAWCILAQSLMPRP
jgi:L-fuculose-phosphate aldolase